jgi:hypothetical protein
MVQEHVSVALSSTSQSEVKLTPRWRSVPLLSARPAQELINANRGLIRGNENEMCGK